MHPVSKYKIQHYKTSRRHIREILGDPEFSGDIYIQHQKVQSMKENIDKSDSIRMKNFCSVKDTVKTMKRLEGNICKTCT
jgi:hypothetical protein